MPTKFIFLILPEVHLLDLAGPDQTIYEAIDFGADFEIIYCGILPNIATSTGLGIQSLIHFTKVKIKPNDFIIIPGGKVKYLLTDKFKANVELFEWLKNCHQLKINLVSICAGAFVLGLAGLLNQISCTTHFKLTTQLQRLYPQTKVKENILFVIENQIYTSAGIASGIDLMLHIVEELTDSYFAHQVARELVIYTRRDGLSTQKTAFFQCRNHIHTGIHKVQDFIIENIHIKVNLSELAQIANMSERNFTRIFKKETGKTVNEYINSIRLEKIKKLLQNPDFSSQEIAKKVGLTSTRHLSRLMDI